MLKENSFLACKRMKQAKTQTCYCLFDTLARYNSTDLYIIGKEWVFLRTFRMQYIFNIQNYRPFPLL